jgi:hypothetical protein
MNTVEKWFQGPKDKTLPSYSLPVSAEKASAEGVKVNA